MVLHVYPSPMRPTSYRKQAEEAFEIKSNMTLATPKSRRNRKSNSRGLRLSWPNANDTRRSVVGVSFFTSYRDPAARISDSHFVHVSYDDLERYYHLPASARFVLHVPLEWNPLQLDVGDADLFQYFQYVASQSLAIFPHDPRDLGNALVRMTLSSNTKSARAALQSLLAFASIHRHNVSSHAVELKLSALKALAAITGTQVGTEEAIHHVVAGMLLCSFEIHQVSCTSEQWTCYLDGAKDIIKASRLHEKAHRDGDLAMLLAWVRYHDVLARFTRENWGRQTAPDTPMAYAEDGMQAKQYQSSFIDSPVSLAAPPGLGIIELLSEVCDALSATPPATAGAETVGEHQSFLKILDWKVRNAGVTATADDDVNTPSTIEVYKLAIVIYLSRTSEKVLNQAPRTQMQIDRAFTLFPQMDSCPRQFPVFILGCEARTDNQRVTILDLISRTDEKSSSRSFGYVKAMLQAVWAQDDLANGNIKYTDKLRRVFGLCSNLPVFV